MRILTGPRECGLLFSGSGEDGEVDGRDELLMKYFLSELRQMNASEGHGDPLKYCNSEMRNVFILAEINLLSRKQAFEAKFGLVNYGR